MYLEDVEIAKFDAENYDSIAAAYRNPAGFGGVAPFALEAAQKLWTLTEELTNTKFNVD